MINKILLILVVVAAISLVNASAQVPIYHLTVKSSPNILFLGGSGDYKSGQSVKIEQAPLVWQEYSFIGWKVDGRWSTENPPIISMDADHTVEAVFEKLNLVGGIVVDTIPRIIDVTVDGNIYLASELPVTFSWEEGSQHIIMIPQIKNTDPTTRYNFDSWKDKNTQAYRTVTVSSSDEEFIALYKTQYLLKSITEYGDVKGSGWHDANSGVNFSLEDEIVLDKKDDNIRYVFNSWNQGDYPNSAENYIDLVNPVSLKSNWDKQYKLTLTSNAADYTPTGSGWHLEGKNVILVAQNSIESPRSNVKYVFQEWISKGPNPVIIPNSHSPSTTIVMDTPYEIEAHYGEAFRVNVWTPYSAAVGGGFYDLGKIAEIKMQQTEFMIEDNKIRKVFTGWNSGNAKTMDFAAADLDPEGIPIGKQNLVVFVDQPLNITANWKTQYYLDIQSTEGKVSGSGWYDVGKFGRFEVRTSSIEQSLWSAIVFDKWTGDLESSFPKDKILMNEPKTVIAEWKEDKTPGIINSVILAGLAGFGIFVYSKTHTKISAGRKQFKELIDDAKPFEKFFNLRKRNPQMDQHPSFYQKPKKKKAIMNWLMGKE